MLSRKLFLKISYCFLGILVLCSCAVKESDIPDKKSPEEPSTQVTTPAEPVHTHLGDSAWSADSEMHWRFCACGKRTDIGIHTLTEDGLCEDCMYRISTDGEFRQVSLLNEHGHAEKTVTYSKGTFVNEKNFEYEYASDGNITQLTTYEKGNTLSQKTYDPNGNVSSEMLYSAPEKQGHQLFTNYADGYSLTLPEGYEADFSLSEVVTAFESKTAQIEIYKQSLSGFSSGSYRRFSNSFLKNTIDHTLDYRGTRYIGGKNTYVTAWHRSALKRVENDKNHYVSFDIKRGSFVYSIFIKSSEPVSYNDYGYIIESLKFFTPTSEHTLWKSKTVSAENRGWNEKTEAFYNKYFGEDASLSWGLFDPDSAYGDLSEIKNYKEQLGYKFPVILTYFSLSEKSYQKLKGTLEESWKNGNVLELTLQTYSSSDGGNMTYDILNGEYDDVLKYYARTIRNFGHPVLFRPMNEMNGDWCLYSAYHTSKDTLIYKEVYRYIYRIFEESGADNIIWVWNPNESSFPDFDWNNALMYYPGDEYVDIVGMTAYNTGTFYRAYGEKWKSFTALYEKLYAEYCTHFSQPFMITEFSCAVKGGDKVAWVEDMFEKIAEYDRIKLAVWWNHVDYDSYGRVARNYLIDDPEAVLDIFKEHL